MQGTQREDYINAAFERIHGLTRGVSEHAMWGTLSMKAVCSATVIARWMLAGRPDETPMNPSRPTDHLSHCHTLEHCAQRPCSRNQHGGHKALCALLPAVKVRLNNYFFHLFPSHTSVWAIDPVRRGADRIQTENVVYAQGKYRAL